MTASRPPVPRVAFVGYSGAGKTSLLERVTRVLTGRGRRIAFLKANAHRIDLDREGKDTHRLQRAGAVAVAIDGVGGSVVFSPPTARQSSSTHPHEIDSPREPETDRSVLSLADWEDFESRAALWDLEVALPEVDLIVIEGMKHSPWPKIVIDRADNPRGTIGATGVRNMILHCDWPALPSSWEEPVAAAAEAIEREIERYARVAEGLVGAVLAGGVSRRMGRDKARLRVRDDVSATWLERNVLLLGELVREPWVIGRIVARGGRDAPSLRRTPRSHLDLRPEAGPLAGLETALRLAEGEAKSSGVPHAVLAIPCDLPGLGIEVLRHLVEARGTAPALAFRRADGRREPAVVLIEASTAGASALALDAGDNSMVEFLETIGVRWIDLPPEWEHAFENINDPESFARWSERTARREP